MFLKCTYTTQSKYFEACKCKYYISLTIIPSCKSILISCGCIPKFKLFFCNGSLWLAIHKNSWYWHSPNIHIFYQHETMVVLFQKISWLSTTFIITITVIMSIQKLDLLLNIIDCSFYKNLGTYCDLY